MAKSKPAFQPKEEQQRKVDAIKKFSRGTYGIGHQQPPPPEFEEDAIIKENLEDTFINQNQ